MLQSRMPRRPLSETERNATVALGRRIAALRKERALTQVELSGSIGIAQSILSSYERGRVRPHHGMLVRLAEALGVSTDALLDRAESSRAPAATAVDRRFLRRLPALRRLPKRDQDALLRTIDVFLSARNAS